MLGSKFTDEHGTQIDFNDYPDTIRYNYNGRKYGVGFNVVRKGDYFTWRICLAHRRDLETLKSAVTETADIADKMRADIEECAKLAGINYELVEKLY